MEQERHDDNDRIRVSDSEREQVAAVLGKAAAEGRLTLDEYTDRVGQAYAAKTRGDLVPLTSDLPAGLPSATAMPFPTPAPGGDLAGFSPSAGAGVDRIIAIFAEDSRTGQWRVPARLEARAVFGSCQLQFQDAQIQHAVTRIEATAIFGEVALFVPEGVEVRLNGVAIFGSKVSKLRELSRPGAPVIEVHCQVAFGSVIVRPPKRRWLRRGQKD
ncbi:MAG: DUF1707 and DUF2154 domain-containing protein [Dactylosporangium sp.]|nr:DUF1707 and DUF2154 domain-containing protein [Dactylosporangium sp.]